MLRPCPNDQAYAQSVLDLTYIGIAATPEQAARLKSEAEVLLCMSSGPWQNTRQIIHHCRYGCCPDAATARTKLKLAVCSVLFHQRPAVPALARWTSLRTVGMFYLRWTKLAQETCQVCSSSSVPLPTVSSQFQGRPSLCSLQLRWFVLPWSLT